MVIRPMTLADLGAVRALLAEVGLASGVANVGRYLAWQPDGAWVADDGVVVGCVTLLRQGPCVGFVGCMAVSPQRQGGGLGRRLLEHAHTESARVGLVTFLLEATAVGEPLYAALGYTVEYETIIATRTPTLAAPLAPARASLETLVAIDRDATGVERGAMLAGLLAEGGPGMVLQEGFGLLVGDRLGPLVARDAHAGRTIFDALAPASAVVTVPAPNAAALTAMAGHGFVEARRLRRMRLGAAVPVRPDRVWCLASAGAG